MVKEEEILKSWNSFSVGVIGDLIYDLYTFGKVLRISPEAPIPILHVQREKGRPGGAGNVLLNILSLGGVSKMMGRVGDDSAGEALFSSLREDGVNLEGLITQKGFKTPVKNRFIADAQQVLRADFENISPLPENIEEKMIQLLPLIFAGVEVLALSDYGKGFLSPTLIAETIQFGRRNKIPIIVDPKGEDFTKYRGATLLKPNLKESYAATQLPSSTPLEKVAMALFKKTDAELLVITRSEEGISLFRRDGSQLQFPVRLREVKDVTGAGDTVLAVICAALAQGIEIEIAIELANIAAGLALESIGCVHITLAEIAARLKESFPL